MPARTRRRDLTVATAADALAQAEIAALREAAARAGRLHDWQAAARPVSPPPGEATAELAAELTLEPARAPARPRKGLRWLFGRKRDPQAERRAAILAELEASVAGRPRAGEAARTLESEAPPAPRPLRAAG